MEITPEVSEIVIAFVAIGALVFVAMIFGYVLPRVFDGLFED